jgi:sugar phosphate isomerase/epimerase
MRAMAAPCSVHHDLEHTLPVGVCRSPDQADVIRASGGEFLEVSCRHWLVPDKPRDAFLERLEQLRTAAVPVLAANSFLPRSLPCVGPTADHDRVLAYAAVAFRRANEAGIRVVTFGSAGARHVPDGYPRADADLQFVALLARLGPLARAHDLTVSVEPLQRSESNMINRVSEARRLVAAVQHPNVGVTADLFHMLRESEAAESIREAGSLIRHVHIAEQGDRTPPGHAGDDFRSYFRALRDIGYNGLVSIECRWQDLAFQLPRAVQTIREQSEI